MMTTHGTRGIPTPKHHRRRALCGVAAGLVLAGLLCASDPFGDVPVPVEPPDDVGEDDAAKDQTPTEDGEPFVPTAEPDDVPPPDDSPADVDEDDGVAWPFHFPEPQEA